MTFLSGLYAAFTGARNSLYDSGFFQARRLEWPVVSVGNISAGGSGKTPFVIMLGEMLAQREFRCDVLSRGYRRRTRGVLKVNANGSPNQYGDEPLLIARKLRCPVIVGEDRYAAGVQAELDYAGAAENPIHLLDDGFQHRRLHRDFDIVLLNREDLSDKLLPLGRLREPLSSLRRADAIVVDSEFPIEQVPKGNFQVWRVERDLEVPPLDVPMVAFCGVARPQRFFSELRKYGFDVQEEIAFRDHHRYTAKDVERLALIQRRIKGASLVTTEKDAINLSAHLTTLRPLVFPMRMKLFDPESAMKQMLETIAKRRP